MDEGTKWGSSVRNVIDVVLLVIVAVAVLLVQFVGKPTIRGYYCDDESIKYPFHENTVTTLALCLGIFLVPLFVVVFVELTADNAWKANTNSSNWSRVPKGLVKVAKRYFVFLFGVGVTILLVCIGKNMIGRLRPHFLAVCQPKEACNSTGYITEYTCTGDPRQVEEARMSFPSGHSAWAFYSAVFVMMYLQCAFRWRRPKLVRHFLQVLVLVGAWYVALTRVTDNWHHWSDVLVGLLIGTIVAVLNVIFVSDLRTRCPTCRAQDSELLIHET